jgi:branched-chain amino acid transport system ATP-binding protein
VSLLSVAGLCAGYGQSQVLFGIDLAIEEGEAVALLGRNGMGKTTTIKSIIGALRRTAGMVEFGGRATGDLPDFRVVGLGIGLVPEGRQIFPNLTVLENLLVSAVRRVNGAKAWDVSAVYDLFPRLRERSGQMGGTLSGGEQQMLAIGRALMLNPRLLIFDEATEGIAPLIRAEIWACIRTLRADGLSILIVDKDVAALREIADRYYVLVKGNVAATGFCADLTPELQRQYLTF